MNSLAQRPKLIILFCSASGISVRPPLATVLSAAASVHLFLSHAAKGGSFGPFDDDDDGGLPEPPPFPPPPRPIPPDTDRRRQGDGRRIWK